jgi:glycerate 2-kinase
LPDLSQLHRYAREIFDYALSSVDPRKAVRQAILVDGSVLQLCGARVDASSRSVYAIAIGKAAALMARGLEDAIGEKLTAGVISGPMIGRVPLDLTRWQTFDGGHPLPNDASLAAARAAFALLDRANEERGMVIFLVSGGGSAMIEWPINDTISLADLRRANQALVASGASIREINAVRRTFSAVKGGGLAARAPLADQVTLIISDVNPGEEEWVASGPTIRPPFEGPYRNCVLLDNQIALEATAEKARQLGFEVRVDLEIREQPIADGCNLLLSKIRDTSKGRLAVAGEQKPVCRISGGEFSCPVMGPGIGGRNSETALRCAIELAERPTEGDLVVLSAGTDGIDGNSPAAGAIADSDTAGRAAALNIDPRDYLERSDAATFFEKLGNSVITGATGTNVRDLRIVLAE